MRVSVLLFLLTAALTATAQQAPASRDKATEELGWTSTMSFEGSLDSSEHVLNLNSSVGYNFNKHFGADFGVPLSFVSSSPAATTGTTAGKGGNANTASSSNSSNGIGNVFTDLRFAAKGSAVNYTSTLTASAPTGSTKHGISTGRPNYGWNNHLEHDFDWLTPFIEAGFSNGLTDTRYFHRPFTSLGFISQFNGGTTVDLGHNVSVGGSLYDVLPAGQQKLFSKLVGKGSTQAAGSGSHGRGWETSAETIGTSSLTRDNGGSVWLECTPGAFDLQGGYTRSVHYALNTVTFSIGVNLGKLMRERNHL